VDWQQAYKVYLEGSRYLGTILPTDFTPVINDISLRCDAIKEDHHRTLRLSISLLQEALTQKEMKGLLSLAINSGSAQCLPVLLGNDTQLLDDDLSALVTTAAAHKKESMTRLLLSHLSANVSSATITAAMVQAISCGRMKSFNVLLHSSEAMFKSYHGDAMLVAVRSGNDYFIKTLLNDPKSGDAKRDYSAAIRLTKHLGKERIAALIATHPKAKLDRKSVEALRSVYGADKANKWLKARA